MSLNQPTPPSNPTRRDTYTSSISANGTLLNQPAAAPQNNLVNQPTAMPQREKHRQEVTVDGFRALGIVSTFIAGVESQCLGLVSEIDGHPMISEATSALLLIGLSLSAFGAALSLLAARWFDLLKGNELTMLEHRWQCAQKRPLSEEASFTKNESDIQGVSNTGDHPKTECKVHPIPDNIKQDVMDFHKNWDWRDYLVAKAISSALLLVFS
ncbi:hypothetical protein RSOLAG1IB_05183 [Rhizoctonia solani AG-1 IB]|uniref:Uncharacterized protein n=1 Tax=Thanatephorus cucumeris (strain AG1-IB / isolate 7/3/14) TaxID=1108050 RepID=A0A0B7G3S7_THACB|nr:hypothetical protein RSOLAG1IB_05183 [Rhizoctonia solani AG-1 IB]